MNVQLGGLSLVQDAADRSAQQVSKSDTASDPSISGDRTTFQSGTTSVLSLVSKAMTAPPIRQDRVDALRQSIASGDYKIDAGKIASALAGSGE